MKKIAIENEDFGEGWSIEDGFQGVFWAKSGPHTVAWFSTKKEAKEYAERGAANG